MPITLWTYVPPAAAVVAIALLLFLLRRRLWAAPHGAIIRANEVAPWRQAQVEHELAWRAIADRCGEGFAGLLTTGIGTVVLLMTLWVMAYIGWTARYGMGAFSNPPVLPPWFGGPLEVVGFAVVGAVVTAFALLALAFFIGAAWFVGTCILWPKSHHADKSESTAREDQP